MLQFLNKQLYIYIAQVVVISWVYGIGQMFDNLKEMNIRLPCVLKAYWWSAMLVLTPAASFVSIFTSSILK